MIYKLIECVYYICCMVCMVCVGEWTFHWTVKSIKRFLIAGIVYLIGFICLQIQGDSRFPFFMLFYVGEIVAWVLISKGELKSRLLKILAIFYGVGVVEVVITLLLEVSLQDKIPEEVLHLVAILLCMVILTIIIRQKWYKSLVEYTQVLPRKGAVLILCAVIGGLLMVGYGNMVRDMVEAKGVFTLYQILFSAELLMVIGIAIWLTLESNQKRYYWEQNVLKEELLHIQQEYYKTIYEKDREMRSFRHDMANQLGMLQLFLGRGDLEGAKVQLESINAEFDEASFQKIHVGDEMLDAIFGMMNQEAEEKHILLEIKGRIENEKQYNSYELCTIFSNAIRNAIEACEKLGNNGPICVKILEEKKALICTVENPATEEMYQQLQRGGTSKDDVENHGYGVGNIQRAVKRLNGEMNYLYQNGKVILEIYI